MSADFEQVMAQCSRGCFTGLLRVRTREGNGEVRFLSGIQDGIRFDSMEGDAALERLLAASEPEFEAISALPPLDFSSSEPVPTEGSLSRFHAAQLMRYCESNSLTCALELEVEGRVLTARYRLGELLSVEPDSEHTARLAEAKEGLYRFRLPRFELPANVQQRRSVPPVAAKPAPASVAKPAAPASVAKPAAPPVAPRSPSPASQAETPLVAMKPVAIVTPSVPPAAAKAPVAQPPAAPPPTQPKPAAAQPKPAAAQPRVTAPMPAAAPPPASAARPATDVRPAASAARPSVSSAPPPPSASSAARREEPRVAPVAAAPQPKPAEPRAPAAPASAPPVAAAPRSPVPRTAPSSAPPSPKPQLDGLWTDAVKPPPQSAPIDQSLRPGAGGTAPKQPGRAEGLSSIAYTPTETPAVPSQRPSSSGGRYWIIAVVLLLAVAAVGWFMFGR